MYMSRLSLGYVAQEAREVNGRTGREAGGKWAFPACLSRLCLGIVSALSRQRAAAGPNRGRIGAGTLARLVFEGEHDMKRSLFGLGLLLLTGCAANAQTTNAPPLMNFQGRLAKPDGTALTDGTHTVTFTLYTQATGGAALWTETDTVTVHNGAFAATLGKITALTDAVFAANDWLEIKVDNAAALSPRQQLVSVASAFKADTALTVPDGSITLTKLAPGVLNFNNIGGTVNTSQFAANTIPINALAGNPLGAISGFSVGPSLVSSISTGATPTSVAVSGNVACVTPQGANSLQVFDVTNPAAPVLSGTVSLGFQPFSVAISGHYAYVAGGINIPNLPTGSANLYTFS